MAQKSKLVKIAVATAAALAIVGASPKSIKPIAEEMRRPAYEMVVLPTPNGPQPNKVLVGATPGVRAWMKKNGIEKDEKNLRAVIEKITKQIASEKKLDVVEAFRVYVHELKEKLDKENLQTSTITPNEFLAMKSPMCLERSVFLVSVLKELGIDAKLMNMELEKDGVVGGHVFVKAKMGSEKLFLDPLHGFGAMSLNEYKRRYFEIRKELKDNRATVYAFVGYSSEYEKYLKDAKSEMYLDEALESKRKNQDE